MANADMDPAERRKGLEEFASKLVAAWLQMEDAEKFFGEINDELRERLCKDLVDAFMESY